MHKTLVRDTQTEAERDALLKMINTRQHEKNENLIREQSRVIDAFKAKCLHFEKEIRKQATNNESEIRPFLKTAYSKLNKKKIIYILDDLNNIQLNELKNEVQALRSIIFRLNIELSSFQAKFPSPSLQNSLKVLYFND